MKWKRNSFREIFRGLLKNRNLFVIIAVKSLFLLTFTLEVLNPVFAQYVLGDETMGSLISMVISLPMILMAVLCRYFAANLTKYIFCYFHDYFVVGSGAVYNRI